MDKLLVHWSNIFDDNIFWPLIRVHIANYCRPAIQWIAFHATVHLQWIIYNAHRPFTNHRSFTIAAFSRGAGAISSTENVLASEKDLGISFGWKNLKLCKKLCKKMCKNRHRSDCHECAEREMKGRYELINLMNITWLSFFIKVATRSTLGVSLMGWK